MNKKLKYTLLYSTFLHLPGIGPVKEKSLWNAGIKNWDDYEEKAGKQLKLFQNSYEEFDDLITDSKEALDKRDIAFFVERLSPTDQYRIPLSLPDEAVFLDIETTGLSIYYDQITLIGWSKGGNFKVIIGDNNHEELLHDLKTSSSIITYNGTIFDIRFLKRDIPNIKIPPCHIDLRYGCLRVGLTGGQKEIEKSVGFERPKELQNVKGENAPTLWYKYQYGDSNALKQLIKYNHSDIEGMKFIFDILTEKYFETDNILADDKRPFKFFTGLEEISFKKESTSKSLGIYIPKYKGEVGPKTNYETLNVNNQLLNNLRVVGIDLTGSEKSETGWAYLSGDEVVTTLLRTDDEIIDTTIEKKPHLISIDSPLSLPKGRNTAFDDDPNRQKYGIMRECERTLKKRGINVYPALIPSMQKLTHRGITLATKFRKMGYPVIESYPGAVQDIIGIPRKGTSLEYLKQGLIEFGLKGLTKNEKFTHDELDAITSAVVGLFFWTGKFEALGNEKEEYLIIPELERDNTSWLTRKAVGISGPIAAGKTTAANILKSFGFDYGRYSLVLKEMLETQGKEENRLSLQTLGEKVNKEYGQRWLGYRLINKTPEKSSFVFDGLRFAEDHAFLIENFGPAFIHLYIEASRKIREKRYPNAKDFKVAVNHQVEREVEDLRKLSTHIVMNEGSMEELKHQLTDILNIN